ncbi:FG-GAP and VCBS repeat-containing protein [Streptomyces sp. NPDC091292]|uniref:FG-GAP and VCBS repeat-containing protein n=1 Tax=Streptomyces sp. NPDC091292 TaxID=3365991 RepID=UPI0037FD73D9
MRHLPLTLAARCAALAALLTAPVVALAAPASAAAPAAPRAAAGAPVADFDGDGYADITAAAPGKGYAAVRYGGPGARQQTPAADPGRMVARDLDGDGHTDLVAGASIRWGSASGLSATPTAIPASLEFNGLDLTAGDFNGDGHPDLIGGRTNGEWDELTLLYGPFDRSGTPASTSTMSTGRTFDPVDTVVGDLTGDGKDDLVTLHAFEEMSETSQLWKGGANGLSTTSTRLPAAASAAIGDVDKDGHADLVIRTVPGGIAEELPYDPGTIQVLYGTASGPSTTRTKTLTQNSAGVPGVSEKGDQFGYRLAAGDVNGDGYADILAGVPGEDLTVGGRNVKDAGAVVLLKGGAGGLSGTGAQAFHQNTAGVPGVAEAGDAFGSAVSLADTNRDGRADAAVGAPGEDTTANGSAAVDSGAVWVLRGAKAGLTATGGFAFNPGDLGAPAKGARLGESFAR